MEAATRFVDENRDTSVTLAVPGAGR